MSKLRQLAQQEYDEPSDDIIDSYIRKLRPDIKRVTKQIRKELKPKIIQARREVRAKDNASNKQNSIESKVAKPKPTAIRDRIQTFEQPQTQRLTNDVVEIPIYAWYSRKKICKTILYFDKADHTRTSNFESKVMYKGSKQALSPACQQLLKDEGVREPSRNGWRDVWRFDHPVTNERCALGELRKNPDLADYFNT